MTVSCGQTDGAGATTSASTSSKKASKKALDSVDANVICLHDLKTESGVYVRSMEWDKADVGKIDGNVVHSRKLLSVGLSNGIAHVLAVSICAKLSAGTFVDVKVESVDEVEVLKGAFVCEWA